MICGPRALGRPAALPSRASRCPPTNTVFPAGGETEGGARGGRQDLRLCFREHRPFCWPSAAAVVRQRTQL
jgi:hypothetical protein